MRYRSFLLKISIFYGDMCWIYFKIHTDVAWRCTYSCRYKTTFAWVSEKSNQQFNESMHALFVWIVQQMTKMIENIEIDFYFETKHCDVFTCFVIWEISMYKINLFRMTYVCVQTWNTFHRNREFYCCIRKNSLLTSSIRNEHLHKLLIQVLDQILGIIYELFYWFQHQLD